MPESVASSVAATPSQRVRLRLDHQVASQPLPLPIPAEPVAEEVPLISAWEGEKTVVPESTDVLEEAVYAPLVEDGELSVTSESFIEESAADEGGSAAAEILPVAEQPSPFFEIPPVTETANLAWFPPPPKPRTVPLWTPSVVPAASASPSAGVVPTAGPTSRPSLDLTKRRQKLVPNGKVPARPELRAAPSLTQLAPPPSSLGVGFWVVLALVALLLAAVLSYFVFVPRLAVRVAGDQILPANPAKSVSFVVAMRGNPVVELPVSGMVEPSRETAIYSRTSGYVRDWLADLGDKVKAGQVLAELDTPEVDHQLVEARASADQAKASLALAQTEAD